MTFDKQMTKSEALACLAQIRRARAQMYADAVSRCAGITTLKAGVSEDAYAGYAEQLIAGGCPPRAVWAPNAQECLAAILEDVQARGARQMLAAGMPPDAVASVLDAGLTP